MTVTLHKGDLPEGLTFGPIVAIDTGLPFCAEKGAISR